ncbi:uncharacterized protein LOC108623747 [Ceratina calcarata]|uniref:Uncharacterized protein LOC108623747 n=1 Tax=Ceratina calcarata TaxID=156304 RepID=A0AAJ7N5J9_9HYME|nr:uncharacterized protein LOC108623747 [Ceratina calcarata]
MVKLCCICKLESGVIPDISLHSIPRDNERRKKWFLSIGREVSKTSAICSQHFEKKDIYYKVVGESVKRFLRSTAYPCLKLQSQSNSEDVFSDDDDDDDDLENYDIQSVPVLSDTTNQNITEVPVSSDITNQNITEVPVLPDITNQNIAEVPVWSDITNQNITEVPVLLDMTSQNIIENLNTCTTEANIDHVNDISMYRQGCQNAGLLLPCSPQYCMMLYAQCVLPTYIWHY